MQQMILVTGHICSGKSTVFKYLKEEIDIHRVDIANIHKLNCNLFRPEKKFNNQEPRVYYLTIEIMNLLFQKKTVYIELLGDEPWFQCFKNVLMRLWVPLLQVELQRKSLQEALKCLNNRTKVLAKKTNRTFESIYEPESLYIYEFYGQTFNLDARKFITDNENCNLIAKEILKMENQNGNSQYVR